MIVFVYTPRNAGIKRKKKVIPVSNKSYIRGTKRGGGRGKPV